MHVRAVTDLEVIKLAVDDLRTFLPSEGVGAITRIARQRTAWLRRREAP